MSGRMILLVIPLVLIEMALAIVALVDWAKRRTYRFLPRWGWFVVIVFVEIVGPVIYLALGRGEERAEPDGRDSV